MNHNVHVIRITLKILPYSKYITRSSEEQKFSYYYDLLVLIRIILKITFYHILNISHVPRFYESQCSCSKNHIKNSITLNISHDLPQNKNFYITLRSSCSNKNHIKNHILPHSKYITCSTIL